MTVHFKRSLERKDFSGVEVPDTRLWWFRPRHWQLFLTQVSKTGTLTTGTFDPDFVTMVPHNAVKEFQNCKIKRFLLQVAKMCFCNLIVSTASSTCRSLYFRGIPDIVCISLQLEIFLIYTGWKIKTRPGPSLAALELTSQNRDTRMEQSRSLCGDFFSILVMSILAL